MEPHSSEAIRAATSNLEAEEARLRAELEDLQAKTSSVVAELKRLRSALNALAGTERARPSPTLQGQAKPTVSTAQVRELAEHALATGPLSAEHLLKRVLEAVRERGLSGTGIHLKLNGVLNDRDRFTRMADGRFAAVEPAKDASTSKG